VILRLLLYRGESWNEEAMYKSRETLRVSSLLVEAVEERGP
jgi:hypothetical protein